MFDEKKARRVIRFIECLRHTKGEFHGKPFKLLPWQEKIIRDVFGTVREDDPTMRQYTTAYIEIPKKQGKSELGAAIALNMLVNDDEWKAEVYSCASDRQQAAISRGDPHGGFLLKKKMHTLQAMGRRFEKEKDKLTQMPELEEAIFLRFPATASVPQGKRILDFQLPRLEAGGRLLAHRHGTGENRDHWPQRLRQNHAPPPPGPGALPPAGPPWGIHAPGLC